MIRVDLEQVDLHLFHQRVNEGRTALETDSPAKAARILKGALDLWQGQALTDLVEAGISWPQLTAAENTRLDTIEDYFEAELQCGHHQSMLRALESTVESEPLRERMCGQLMLALYRCGRQADALKVYSRLRASLIDNLGLEPRRELQSLQQAILNHSTELSLSGPPMSAERVERVRADGSPVADREPEEPRADYSDLVEQEAEAPLPLHAAGPPQGASPSASPTGQRRTVSVLLFKSDFGLAPGAFPLSGTEDLHDDIADRVRGLITAFDGTVISSIGSTHLAVFGALDSDGNHARSAVRAATAIRDELHAKDAVVPLSRPAQGWYAPTLHAAVATGEARLRYLGTGETMAVWSADGEPLEESRFLLRNAGPGEILVCGTTRQLTASAVSYERAGDTVHAWKATEDRARFRTSKSAGPVSREVELDVLRGLWHRVRYHGMPHVVTILGGPNTGKSQLLKDFERRILDEAIPTRFLSYSAPCQSQGRLWGARRSLRTRPGPLFTPQGAGAEARMAELSGLLDPQGSSGGSEDPRPVVVAIDDLHLSDGTFLDYVGNLCSRTASGPVLVVTTARRELFRRRPGWGGGMSLVTSLSIDPPALCLSSDLRTVH
ncbi:BTAD domain-containing putative transcriptional regulator [Streptomyces sp. NPDC001339]|uniref:BTAD domain-containing putative transcriptional regulator n=1 Tax=Streptomyces sp. NPDC001339 TaxID=3364563 RepID=UPI0036CE353E